MDDSNWRFRLGPWASRRRRDLLELLDRLSPTIEELSQAIMQEAEKCPVEAAQAAVRGDPQWRSKYLRLLMRRGRKPAKAALGHTN